VVSTCVGRISPRPLDRNVAVSPPPSRQRRSDFDQEPNPFERSFSHPQQSATSPTGHVPFFAAMHKLAAVGLIARHKPGKRKSSSGVVLSATQHAPRHLRLSNFNQEPNIFDRSFSHPHDSPITSPIMIPGPPNSPETFVFLKAPDLFLLAQAHRDLTKREAARRQPQRLYASPADTRRGSIRMSLRRVPSERYTHGGDPAAKVEHVW
jgi:hypothetical protein